MSYLLHYNVLALENGGQHEIEAETEHEHEHDATSWSRQFNQGMENLR